MQLYATEKFGEVEKDRFSEWTQPADKGLCPVALNVVQPDFKNEVKYNKMPLTSVIESTLGGYMDLIVEKDEMMIRFPQEAHAAMINENQCVTVDESFRLDLDARVSRSKTNVRFQLRAPYEEEKVTLIPDPAFVSLKDTMITDKTANAIRNVAILQGIERTIVIDNNTRKMISTMVKSDSVEMPMLVRFATMYVTCGMRDMMGMQQLEVHLDYDTESYIHLDSGDKMLMAVKECVKGRNMIYLPDDTPNQAIRACMAAIRSEAPDNTFEVSKMWPAVGNVTMLTHMPFNTPDDTVITTQSMLMLITAYCCKYGCWDQMQNAMDLVLTMSFTEKGRGGLNLGAPVENAVVTLPAFTKSNGCVAPLSHEHHPMHEDNPMVYDIRVCMANYLVKACTRSFYFKYTCHKTLINPFDVSAIRSGIKASVTIRLMQSNKTGLSNVQHSLNALLGQVNKKMFCGVYSNQVSIDPKEDAFKAACKVADDEEVFSSLHTANFVDVALQGTSLGAMMTKFHLEKCGMTAGKMKLLKTDDRNKELAAVMVASAFTDSSIHVRLLDTYSNVFMCGDKIRPPRIAQSKIVCDSMCNVRSVMKSRKWVFGVSLDSMESCAKMMRLAMKRLEWQLYITKMDNNLNEESKLEVSEDPVQKMWDLMDEMSKGAVQAIKTVHVQDQETYKESVENILREAGVSSDKMTFEDMVKTVVETTSESIMCRVSLIEHVLGSLLTPKHARQLLFPMCMTDVIASSTSRIFVLEAMAERCDYAVDINSWDELPETMKVILSKVVEEAIDERAKMEEVTMKHQLNSIQDSMKGENFKDLGKLVKEGAFDIDRMREVMEDRLTDRRRSRRVEAEKKRKERELTLTTEEERKEKEQKEKEEKEQKRVEQRQREEEERANAPFFGHDSPNGREAEAEEKQKSEKETQEESGEKLSVVTED